MNVNQLIAALKKEQKAGNGQVEVHIIAHDNCPGETQGVVSAVEYYEKDPDEDNGFGGRDEYLYSVCPDRVVYIK